MSNPNNYDIGVPDGDYMGACMEVAGIESCGLGVQPSPIESTFNSGMDTSSSENAE